MTDQRYPLNRHIRHRAEFLQIYEQGRRASGRVAVVFCLRQPQEDTPWRLGLTATKKALGKAVHRNRARRRAREFFRRRSQALPSGWDFVVNLKPPAVDAPAEVVARDLQASLRRLGFEVPLAAPTREGNGPAPSCSTGS